MSILVNVDDGIQPMWILRPPSKINSQNVGSVERVDHISKE